jgi:GNAT superfamily N-acetyltransferase
MHLHSLPAHEAATLVPLLQDLHDLHVAHHPERYPADPCPQVLTTWLTEWLTDDMVHALVAESPTGTIMGYVIWEFQERSASPLTTGGARAMVHHVMVAAPFRRLGVGKALLKAVRDQAQTEGAVRIAASYAPFNTASAALMASMGMQAATIHAECYLSAPTV